MFLQLYIPFVILMSYFLFLYFSFKHLTLLVVNVFKSTFKHVKHIELTYNITYMLTDKHEGGVDFLLHID